MRGINRKDYTEQCLADLGPEIVKQIGGENGLRKGWCATCIQKECLMARRNTSWEERISTQEERLLRNPQFADPNSSRYEALTKTIWPSLFAPANSSNNVAGWDTIPKGTAAERSDLAESQKPRQYPVLPTRLQTPYPAEGKMIDGTPAGKSTTQIVDPWAISKEVKPGETITFTDPASERDPPKGV